MPKRVHGVNGAIPRPRHDASRGGSAWTIRAHHVAVDDATIARREDWDAFETNFRRRHLASRLIAICVLAVIGVGTWYGSEWLARQPVQRAPLTLEQAAQRSGYSRDHIGRLLRSGRLENVGSRGRPRVRASDLPVKAKSGLQFGTENEQISPRRRIALSVTNSNERSA